MTRDSSSEEEQFVSPVSDLPALPKDLQEIIELINRSNILIDRKELAILAFYEFCNQQIALTKEVEDLQQVQSQHNYAKSTSS